MEAMCRPNAPAPGPAHSLRHGLAAQLLQQFIVPLTDALQLRLYRGCNADAVGQGGEGSRREEAGSSGGAATPGVPWQEAPRGRLPSQQRGQEGDHWVQPM